MKTTVRIILFMVLLLWFYTWFSNSVPQIRGEPPVEQAVSLRGMTMEAYINLGRALFNGKGTCTLCHNAVTHRAPLLIEESEDGHPVGVRAQYRIKNPRYGGEASSPEEYIRESMIAPSAFVVKGFGKTGSNDTASPMPPVKSGAIGLSDIEINAIVAFLQKVSGVAVTVSLPRDEPPPAVETEEPPPAGTMAQLAEKYRCRLCHAMPGLEIKPGEGEIGPPLKGLSRFRNDAPGGLDLRGYIRQSILTPNAYIAKGYEADIMPDDFADRMRVSELELAVETLASEAGKR